MSSEASGSISIRVFPLGLLRSNVYLVFDEKTREAAIIDAGGGTQYVMREVRRLDLRPKLMLLTHGHFDHTFELADMRNSLGVRSYIHKRDLEIFDVLWESGISLLKMKISPPKIDVGFEGEPHFELGSMRIKVLHTPGHTPGSVCYYIPGQEVLFSGDTLFKGSIGRTDLPGGDHISMIDSLKKLMSLDDRVVIYPGHGLRTTIGRERRSNPFIAGI